MGRFFLIAFAAIPLVLGAIGATIFQRTRDLDLLIIAGTIGFFINLILSASFIKRFGHHLFSLTESKLFRIGLITYSIICYIAVFAAFSIPTEWIDSVGFY